MLAIAVGTTIWSGEQDQVSQPGAGQVHIASVENNHTERVQVVVFTVTEDEAMVDGNASSVMVGDEEDFGLLNCRDGDRVASHLRVQVNTDGEPGYEIEESVELGEWDCGDGDRTEFMLILNGGDNFSVGRGT